MNRSNKHENSQQGYNKDDISIITSRSPSPLSERTARINPVPNKSFKTNENPFTMLDYKEYKKNFTDLYMGKNPKNDYYRVQRNIEEPPQHRRLNKFDDQQLPIEHKKQRSLSEEFFNFMAQYTSELKTRTVDGILAKMDCQRQPDVGSTYYKGSQISNFEYVTEP